MARSVIDNHPKKDEIIAAILAGVSYRKVGDMAGISSVAVMNYRNRHLIPKVNEAFKIARLQDIAEKAKENEIDPKEIVRLTKAVASVGEGTIWHERQEKLATLGLETLELARDAVRTFKDDKGKDVVDGKDFNPVWQGINALARVQEIDGKARRILGDDAGLSIKADQMFLILPRIELPEPEPMADAGPVIDVSPAESKT